MPLARGTAVVGYITLLGLFLAANMKITTSVPKNFQVYYYLERSWRMVVKNLVVEALMMLVGM